MIYPLARAFWLAICWVELALFTAALYALSFLARAWLGDGYFALFRAWCRVFVRALGVDLRLHQKNGRPLPRQYILIANHPSALEDVGVPALFPVRSLAKIEVRDWWWVGRITRAAGTVYVRRESSESRHAASDELADVLARGYSIGIYPEGGCKGRRLHDSFQYGAFALSLKTGIPILPLFLHYEAQEDFEWQPPYTLLDKIRHMMTTRNNRANYYVFDALDPRQFGDKQSYHDHVYGLYQQWQAKYLE